MLVLREESIASPDKDGAVPSLNILKLAPSEPVGIIWQELKFLTKDLEKSYTLNKAL